MAESVVKGKKKKELTLAEKKYLYFHLKSLDHGGKLPDGSLKKVAAQVPVAPKTVGRVYRELKEAVDAYTLSIDIDSWDGTLPDHLFAPKSSSRRAGKCKWLRADLRQLIKTLPLKQRRNYRVLSNRINIPLSSLHKIRKEGLLKPHRVTLKPTMTEQHKANRLEYALKQVDTNTLNLREIRFRHHHHDIHVDEKWFYLTKEGQRYSLADDERLPKLTTRSKHSIEKVMFLCAQARPRRLSDGSFFDGKLGCWPFGCVGQAQKRSKNRRKGDPVWVNVNVNRDECRLMLVVNLLPAIAERWPGQELMDDNTVITIQQDGARTHLPLNDGDWLEELEELGLQNKVKILTQPAQSPDLNINDLGFFNSLQARHWEHNPTSSFDIIEMVQQTHTAHDPATLNRIWLTHQSVLNQVIETGGDNKCTIPHMNKRKLEKENRLPTRLQTTEKARELLGGDVVDNTPTGEEAVMVATI